MIFLKTLTTAAQIQLIVYLLDSFEQDWNTAMTIKSKIKLSDEKHLNFLEIEYEAQYDKIFKREDISFQTIA